MPTRVQLRRGTTAQHATFTGADGEVTVDTDKEVVVVHNGSTAGGFPLLRQDFSNIVTYSQGIVAVAALDINCSLGNFFTKTISANSTFTFSNAPASKAFSFTLELTHTSGTVTWPSSVRWPGGTAPTLTTGKTHLFMFVTDDGGTLWRGSSLINYTTS